MEKSNGIKIDVDDKEVREYLKLLEQKLSNLGPPFKAIATYLRNSTKLRFTNQAGPDGAMWPTSKRASKDKGEREDKGQTLVDTGRLRSSITSKTSVNQIENIEKTSIEFGTNVIYAAMMQYGCAKGKYSKTIKVKQFKRRKAGKKRRTLTVKEHDRRAVIPWGNIPPRPFLGINKDDADEILNLMNDFIST
ncbi:MAG: phage virion morphogenesis protein [Candidatus Riflebacteria bacterium]|nr:phage virion morphogenesis protein [Candidatus Riflebacteria bacterium]